MQITTRDARPTEARPFLPVAPSADRLGACADAVQKRGSAFAADTPMFLPPDATLRSNTRTRRVGRDHLAGDASVEQQSDALKNEPITEEKISRRILKNNGMRFPCGEPGSLTMPVGSASGHPRTGRCRVGQHRLASSRRPSGCRDQHVARFSPGVSNSLRGAAAHREINSAGRSAGAERPAACLTVLNGRGL